MAQRGCADEVSPEASIREPGSEDVPIGPLGIALFDNCVGTYDTPPTAHRCEVAPEQEPQEDAEYTSEHQDDPDGVEAKAGGGDVNGECQNCTDHEEEDADTDAHDPVTPWVRWLYLLAILPVATLRTRLLLFAVFVKIGVVGWAAGTTRELSDHIIWYQHPEHRPGRVQPWAAWWAWPLSRTLIDPDGRPLSLRRSPEFRSL